MVDEKHYCANKTAIVTGVSQCTWKLNTQVLTTLKVVSKDVITSVYWDKGTIVYPSLYNFSIVSMFCTLFCRNLTSENSLSHQMKSIVCP